MSYIVAFGRFWYDFIVGDSIVLAIGGVGVIVLGAVLVEADAGTLADVLVPTAVVAALVLSLRPFRSG